MKKKRFLSLLAVAPLALLAACSSTPGLVLEANWFSNTGTKNIPDDFEERLEYAVSFEKSAASEGGRFSLDYPEGGTYKVTFSNGRVNGQKTFVYTTESSIKAKYTLDGVSTNFEEPETVKTRVEFLDVQNELRPLSSSREVHGTAPLCNPTDSPKTLASAYRVNSYKTEVVYKWEEETATFTRTYFADDTAGAKQETREIDVDCNGLFFDNEQLFPLLRAAELSSSMAIYTIDPTDKTKVKMSVKSGPSDATLKQSVSINGAEAKEIDFNVTEIGLGYDKKNSGGTQTFTIAKRGARDSNTYRNVMLKYSYPVIYSHGTITYRLTTANFYG